MAVAVSRLDELRWSSHLLAYASSYMLSPFHGSLKSIFPRFLPRSQIGVWECISTKS